MLSHHEQHVRHDGGEDDRNALLVLDRAIRRPVDPDQDQSISYREEGNGKFGVPRDLMKRFHGD